MSLKKKLSIHIKKKNQGLLSKKMGVPEQENIPSSALSKKKEEAKESGNTKLEKEVVFAQNAKRFHHD